MASALELTADIAEYEPLLQKLQRAYRKRFYHPETKSYSHSGVGGNIQSLNVFPLVVNATPADLIPDVMAALLKSIADPDGLNLVDAGVSRHNTTTTTAINSDVSALGQSTAPAKGGRLNCGIVGSRFILETLTRYGHADLALQLVVQNGCPSWNYMLEEGPGGCDLGGGLG
jgi:hypothetical protein